MARLLAASPASGTPKAKQATTTAAQGQKKQDTGASCRETAGPVPVFDDGEVLTAPVLADRRSGRKCRALGVTIFCHDHDLADRDHAFASISVLRTAIM